MSSALLLENPDRVIAKAWADEDFRAALLADPKAALKAQGIEVPDGVTLKVHEDSPNVINLVLPKSPDLALVEEQLGEGTDPLRCGCGGCRCGGCGGCGGGCSCIPCTCVCY